MSTQIQGQGPDQTPGVIDDSLEDGSDVVRVANPSVKDLEAIVGAVNATSDLEAVPDIQILAKKDVLRSFTDDFRRGSQLANLTESGVVEIRVSEADFWSAYIVTESQVIALLNTLSGVNGIQDDTTEIRESISASFDEAWDDSKPYNLRTPSYNRVSETMDEEVGEGVFEDFDAMAATLDTVASEDESVDEVVLSLLAAARNEAQLYDVGKWGEYNDVSSKATFSRCKSTLEENGIITTEKIHIDIGRPRQRLVLTEDYAGLSPEELVDEVVPEV